MVIELVMTFKDEVEGDELPPLEFSYTLNAPEDFEVTGGQLFVENPTTKELDRFTFRIDRADDGNAIFTVVDPLNE